MSAGKFSKALPRQQWWCCAGPASISSLASGGEVILRHTISRLYASGCREFCFDHFLYLDGIQSPGCSCLSWLAWEDLATDCSSTPGLRWLPQPTLQSWSMAVFPSLRFWCPASPSAIDRGAERSRRWHWPRSESCLSAYKASVRRTVQRAANGLEICSSYARQAASQALASC